MRGIARQAGPVDLRGIAHARSFALSRQCVIPWTDRRHGSDVDYCYDERNIVGAHLTTPIYPARGVG